MSPNLEQFFLYQAVKVESPFHITWENRKSWENTTNFMHEAIEKFGEESHKFLRC